MVAQRLLRVATIDNAASNQAIRVGHTAAAVTRHAVVEVIGIACPRVTTVFCYWLIMQQRSETSDSDLTHASNARQCGYTNTLIACRA